MVSTDVPEGAVRHRHLGDHQAVLADLPRGAGKAKLDAIVVPSNRPPRQLDFAVRLAGRLRVPILIITSDRWSGRDAGQCLQGRRGAVVRLRPSVRKDFFDLTVAAGLGPRARSYADTAAKRNVGLKIALAMGWQTVLFLDDDTRGLKPSRVVGAVHALRSSATLHGGPSLRVVGFRSTHYPDNSVVCHLRRKVGLVQTQFIGSGALLVDVDRDLPFFPPVYNEDWLFLHDWVSSGLVASGGTVKQLTFNPFRRARARREEFGDVLAEGMYELVHGNWPLEFALRLAQAPGFWREALDARRRMHDDVREGLDRMAGELKAGDPEFRMLPVYRAVIDAAGSALATIRPEELAAFVRAWRADLSVWRDQLANVKPAADLETALRRQNFRRIYINY